MAEPVSPNRVQGSTRTASAEASASAETADEAAARAEMPDTAAPTASGEDTAAAAGAESSEAREVAARDEDVVDELPDDLRAAGYVGPYLFPNNNRRRIPGYLYLAIAAGAVVTWAVADDSAFVNRGFLLGGVLLALVGVYHLIAGWNLDVDEQDALVAASRQVGFPVGHASAQLGWRSLRSRPVWRILLYSGETPPAKRGLVLVDGVDGHVVEHFVEDNPEDWSELSADGPSRSR